jgi:plastocyanin
MNDRRLRPLLLLFSVVMILAAVSASATNFTVNAIGDGYYYEAVFQPSTLQIHVGDTVTFANASAGTGMHNVHADNGSFQCSTSCSSPNNAPSTASWSFQKTFTTAGTVAFHCDMHGAVGGVGMSGSITVLAAGAPGSLAFSAPTYSVSGTAANTTISVARTGGTSGAASVHFATSDGTAKAGTEYTTTSGTLNWADGDGATKTFSVPVVHDASASGNLTVNLALTSPTGATLGAPASSVLTIQEGSAGSAGSLSFSQASYSASENEGNATITVNRTGGKSGAVTVHFAATAGTAVSGTNFTNASGTLNFANNQTSATFAVPILDDHHVDPTLTVQLALSDATAGASVGTGTATLNILDADGTGGAPPAPTNLKAVAVDTSTIELSWNDNSTNEVGFEIQASLLGGTFADVANAPANSGATATFQVTGLTAATGYQFQVRALGGGNPSAFSNIADGSTNAVPAACVANANTLCLGDNGRFQVQVSYSSSAGSGNATAVPLSANPDSGLLYFFGADNIEMLVKVLNACTAPFNTYWVFFAATTNVQFTTTVIDTTNGATRTYFNPLNQSAAPIQDTSGFSTCP